MTYLESLSPWCIVKLMPNMQRLVVARCRRRNDAEEHVRVLRRLLPGTTFAIIFDSALEHQKLPAEENRANF
ncbi:MAG TPA: hypothetical protein V6D30_21940 [Leptolyngbyaceae cyanobacterium]